ncbi:MAG: hypothetical protein QME32_07635 [Endomicrobiia bacterium]|nr:hypothetical protein [Endomicrobiia bacterium]
MQKIIFAHMSSKFLVTVPKEARRVLGLEGGSGPIGFIIEPETRTVKLTRINITPADEDFTDGECLKLLKLADNPGGEKLDKITIKSIAGDNPDLPLNFIKDILEAKSQKEMSMAKPFSKI